MSESRTRQVYLCPRALRGVGHRYGKPIPLSELEAQFATENVEESKLAVKQLTKLVEQTLYRMTINANDWETLYAGTMARDLLYERAGSLNPDDFVTVSQL